MKKTLFAFALGVCASGWALAAQPLLTPAELQPLLSQPQVRVVDIRDPKSYAANHIPGAVNAPYAQWRGPASNAGELPPVQKLAALVQSLGLSPATHAVVVSTGKDTTDFGAMARVYWTLKSLGLKELSIVNGGMQAWTAAQLPLSQTAPQVTPSSYQAQFDTSLLATTDDIRRHVDLSNATLIDSRPDAFYQGQTRAPAAKISGTLPGAQQLDFNQWFVPGSTQFVDAAQAKQVAARIQTASGKDTVAFCNTGHWAATDWFGLSEMAGLPNVKLYAGSMVEWTQSAERPPMANEPTRLQSLSYDAKQWWERKLK